MYRVGRKLLFLHCTEREICKLITGDDDGGRAAAGAVAHPRPLQLPLLLRGVPRGQRRQGEHSPAQEHQQPGRMHQAGQCQQPSGYTGVIHYLESMLNRR